jgi:cbb3-type cytochrome oxidase cytochrome c subunit
LIRYLVILILLIGILLSGSADSGTNLSSVDQSTPSSGQNLYCRLSCHGCHILKEQGFKQGPDLDGISRVLSRKELEIQLTTPRHRKKNSRMPSFAFVQPMELQSLLDFLEILK